MLRIPVGMSVIKKILFSKLNLWNWIWEEKNDRISIVKPILFYNNVSNIWFEILWMSRFRCCNNFKMINCCNWCALQEQWQSKEPRVLYTYTRTLYNSGKFTVQCDLTMLLSFIKRKKKEKRNRLLFIQNR